MTDTRDGARPPTAASFERLATGALAGALLGAVAWVVAAQQFGLELEFVAFVLGWLAAKGAVRAAPAAGGWLLFGTALVAAVAGFLGAKYVNFVLAAREQIAPGLGWVDGETWDLFVLNLDVLFGASDVIWAVALLVGVTIPVARLVADRRQAQEAAEAATG